MSQNSQKCWKRNRRGGKNILNMLLLTDLFLTSIYKHKQAQTYQSGGKTRSNFRYKQNLWNKIAYEDDILLCAKKRKISKWFSLQSSKQWNEEIWGGCEDIFDRLYIYTYICICLFSSLSLMSAICLSSRLFLRWKIRWHGEGERQREPERGRGGGRQSNNCSGGLYPHWVTTGRLVTSTVSISALTPTPHTHTRSQAQTHTHIDR